MARYGDPYSEFVLCIQPIQVRTHTHTHTHTVITHMGSSWGFGALLKGLTSVVVLQVERALVIHSSHQEFLLDLGLKTAAFGL